jgi:single-strand DNA-binding protein
MKDVNRIILIGRLGADPIQRQTKGGIVVVHFPLATSRRVMRESAGGGQGVDASATEKSEETVWHRVVAWGRQGELCTQYLSKGQTVYVEGSIRSHKYSGKDGVERWVFEVHADHVGFLGGAFRKPQSMETTEDSTEEAASEAAFG